MTKSASAGGSSSGQRWPQSLSDLINVLPEDVAVRPGEIDVFEDAEPPVHLGDGLLGMEPVLVDQDDFSGFDVADVLGLHQIQGAGLRGQDVSSRSIFPGTGDGSRGDRGRRSAIFGQEDQGISPPNLGEGLNRSLHIPVPGPGDEMDEDLAVHGGLKDRPLAPAPVEFRAFTRLPLWAMARTILPWARKGWAFFSREEPVVE